MLNETDVENYMADLRRVQELRENVSLIFPHWLQPLKRTAIDALESKTDLFNDF